MKNKKSNSKIIDNSPRTYLSKSNFGNLKAFKGENEIEFAPMVNLIFGKNSSGKSTINQSLRLFRQSYGFDKLTPFNYESPSELRGKGGLDIDVGYIGLVNNGDIKSNISLGLETGIFESKEKKISKKKFTIKYTYKFVKNFYSGKNLVKENTILKQIKYSNEGGEILVDLPRYKFFEDKSELGESIRQGQRFHVGDYFSASNKIVSKSDNIYGSVYNPYYYETDFNYKNIKINSLDEAFDDISKIDRKVIINFYNNFLKYLEKNKKKIKKSKSLSARKKNEMSMPAYDFISHRKRMDPLYKDVIKTRKICDGDIKKQIEEFLKIPDKIFQVYEDEFLDFDESPNEKIKQIDDFSNQISKLILFFLNKTKLSKKEFNNFFKKDICSKCKKVIFFNGYFMYLPDTKNKLRNSFREQKNKNYLINILNFLISSHRYFREVDIFNGYQDRYGRGENSTMSNISKVMNKFLVAPGLRQIPKRYFVKGLQTDYVGPSAENLGELLANPEINKETNKWFKKLEIPYKVDIQKSGNYYEIVFLPLNSKIKISSMHVGLGYPLILPFIVQCIIAKNKIILIEEPEVHLHPKIEADLADLIVESSSLRNNQFIIETHSEDFLLRILKSIRKGKLKPEHVSVNYIIPNEKKGSKINKININKFGQYTTPWQDNLFAERRREFGNK